MKKRNLLLVGLSIVLPLTMAAAYLTTNVTEVEPNNTPATANTLNPTAILTGSIQPTGDQDFFALAGINTTWGYIALLDTTASTGSVTGTLTALASDGTTVLQTDTGSWEHGSGIALQSYDQDSQPFTNYLRVNEQGNDAQINDYTLRYYNTVTRPQPEIEPNDSKATGTVSSFTHNGAIDPAGDKDCFDFQGRAGDTVIIALNDDPEGDGSPIDPVLQLVDPNNHVLKQANVSGMGGNEFIEAADLVDGIYAYCVSAGAGTAGPTATYTVGLVRNGQLYFPNYMIHPVWTNARAGQTARIGDLMTFKLGITSASPLPIPGEIRITSSYNPDCLELVSTDPAATTTTPGDISWGGQKPDGLAPYEDYEVTLTLRATALCNDKVYQATGVDYFFTGYGNDIYYTTTGGLVFLPLLMRTP